MTKITIADTYVGPSLCSAEQIDTAFAKNGKSIPNLGNLIVRWTEIFPFRAELIAGQIAEETGWGTNYWAVSNNNILSVGVTGEASIAPMDTADWQVSATPNGKIWLRGYRFSSVESGLLAGLIHLATYIYGQDAKSWPLTCRQYCGDSIHNPRLPVLLGTQLPGTVQKVADLGNGRFAPTLGYAQSIASRANTILGIPHPITAALGIPAESQAFYMWLRQRGITVVENYIEDGWLGRGGMQPEAIVHHVTDGNGIMGAINHWNEASVDASTQQLVAAQNDPDFPDGALIIARRDEDTAWANGIWNNPNLDISTINRWYEQNINPNRVTLAREHDGRPFSGTFPSAAQMRTSLFADLNWMAKYPTILPDRNHFIKHSDIDSVNRANCPGPRFNLESLIAQVIQSINAPNNPNYTGFLNMWQDIADNKVSVLDAWQKYWN